MRGGEGEEGRGGEGRGGEGRGGKRRGGEGGERRGGEGGERRGGEGRGGEGREGRGGGGNAETMFYTRALGEKQPLPQPHPLLYKHTYVPVSAQTVTAGLVHRQQSPH